MSRGMRDLDRGGASRFTALATLVLAAACGGADAAPPPPETRTVDVVDTIHGTPVPDPYRWLEPDSAPDVQEWIDRQNAYAQEVVGETALRDSLRARFRALYDAEADVGSTRDAGEWEYFTLRRRGQERERIVRRPDPEVEDPPEPDPETEYEVVLDPMEWDPAGRISLGIVDFTTDGSLMLYSVRVGGADEQSYRVLDTETLETLSDSLPNALYGDVRFGADDDGFYYTHRDRMEGPRIRYHELGTDAGADALVWGEGYGPETFVGMEDVADGRYRIFTANHGWAWNEVWIQDRTGAAGPTGGGEIRPVVVDERAHFNVDWHDGRLWMRTDLAAPMYRLLAVRPDALGRESWEEVIPEGESLLRSWDVIDDRIFATYLVDVADRIRIFEMDGTPAGEIEVSEHRSARVSDGDGDGNVRLSVEGYLRPEVTYEVDLGTGERTLVDAEELPFDTTGTVVEQVWHTSADGTEVPMYVMRRVDVPLDGTAPTILNGYGGFNVSITPGFSETRALWVELGGIYAVTTLRGGSEFGEMWHRAGMLENKQNVFDDFISAAEWLVENDYTSPAHLGISGGSNGGLLVASAMTQRPELFGAVRCTYPDLDMIRFPHYHHANNKPALLEYGDSRIAEQFDFLEEYSPYQAVEEGVAYPAVYLATGHLDTRVPPAQARKMAARLQAATSSGEPVILVHDPKGGHAGGRGRPLSMRIESAALEHAFMMEELGLTGWAEAAGGS